MAVERDYASQPGSVMKMILMAMGKSQKWLAEQMRITPTEVSYMFNGKRPVTLEQIVVFCNVTGFPEDKLASIKNNYDMFVARKNVAEYECNGTITGAVHPVAVNFVCKNGVCAAYPKTC